MKSQHRRKSTAGQFKLTPIATALLFAFAMPLPAGAQSSAADAKKTPVRNAAADTQLPEVNVSEDKNTNDYQPTVSTVGGKVATPIRDIAQSVTVINRAVMEAQAAYSLPQALRNVPGITLGAAEGGTIGNNINLRGFSARTDVFLDGMRDRGQYYRDVFFLESVEVLKGPSSMLFGRGSTGGVINQVSKVPTLTLKNEVSATVGTNDFYRSTADFNHPLSDTSALRVEVMGQKLHTTRDVMANEDYGVAPSFRMGIGTPTEVTLSALFLHNRDMPDYGFPAINGKPVDVPRNTFYGLTDDRTVQDVTVLSALIDHKINSNMTLRNHTQYSKYKIDALETAPNSVGTLAGNTFTILPTKATGGFTNLPLSSLFVQLASHDRQIEDESLYNQTDLISTFNTGFVKHSLITGLELGHDTYTNQAFARTGFPILTLVNPAYTSQQPGVVTTVGNFQDSSSNTVAPYVNDTIELTKQWKVVGGLRYDRFRAGTTNTVSLPGSASQTVSFTSVRGGVIYQPTEYQSYYVSYGTSFDPSLETLTVTNGQQALPPVKNRSVEAGAKWDFLNGNLSLNSAVFRVEQFNARSQISTGVYQLTGDVVVKGIELGIAGRITPQWQVFAGYTYLDAEIVKASPLDNTQGKVPANVPRNSASLWTTYNVTPEWETGGGVTFLSSRFTANTDFVSVDSYARWDATVAYHKPKYEIRLNLLNLTDEKFFDALIPSDGGRSVPGIGRTALMTLTYKF
ncbi:MAG: TonB-dependent siderophore receptor [Betaproteobacteria bacterium]